MKYLLVQFPESQYLMQHKRFNECLLVSDIEGHDEVGSSAYMCPEDLYNELFNINNTNENIKRIFNNLKHNPHGTYSIIDNKIEFKFNSLDNLIIMMIESKKYTENIKVDYDEFSNGYNHRLIITI